MTTQTLTHSGYVLKSKPILTDKFGKPQSLVRVHFSNSTVEFSAWDDVGKQLTSHVGEYIEVCYETRRGVSGASYETIPSCTPVEAPDSEPKPPATGGGSVGSRGEFRSPLEMQLAEALPHVMRVVDSRLPETVDGAFSELKRLMPSINRATIALSQILTSTYTPASKTTAADDADLIDEVF